jgi:hypothetical protein
MLDISRSEYVAWHLVAFLLGVIVGQILIRMGVILL